MGKTKSIVTKYEQYCAFCGRPATEEHHLVFGGTGGANRKLADEDGIILPVCPGCHRLKPVKEKIHDNPMAEKLSRMAGQLAFEKRRCAEGATEEDAREMFRKRYGVSYL